MVSSITDKLPPSWKDQRKLLKHKKQDMSLDSLAQYLQVEQQLRQKGSQDENVVDTSKVHMVEEKQSDNASNNSSNKKRKRHNNNNSQNK